MVTALCVDLRTIRLPSPQRPPRISIRGKCWGKLESLRLRLYLGGPGESHSDVILRLAAEAVRANRRQPQPRWVSQPFGAMRSGRPACLRVNENFDPHHCGGILARLRGVFRRTLRAPILVRLGTAWAIRPGAVGPRRAAGGEAGRDGWDDRVRSCGARRAFRGLKCHAFVSRC